MKWDFYECVLENFHHCSKQHDCSTCLASLPIGKDKDTDVSYCDFLRAHDRYIEDRILLVLSTD